MEACVAVLKQCTDEADRRRERMERKPDQIPGRPGQTATKATAWGALGTGAVLSFAVVTMLLGVLTYSPDQRIAARPEPTATATPQPIIIQMPPWPTVPPAPPSPAAPG